MYFTVGFGLEFRVRGRVLLKNAGLYMVGHTYIYIYK